MPKIIVAGGGHGGIVAAALLARNGFDVTVYEKNKRENMGYDWTDILNRNAFGSVGIALPADADYPTKTAVTFYSPSERNRIVQPTTKRQPEIKMERREIYNLILDFAEKNGVKFEYSVNIESAETLGNRVVGIRTDKGVFYADLIIDACGCNSPVRRSLPPSFGIQREAGANEKLYGYRVFFDRINKDIPADSFKITIFSQKKQDISWVMADDEFADVFAGKFEPFGDGEEQLFIDHIRKMNPCVGERKIRAGSFVEIPVRQSLAVMVADGYAAIGDSAFMTVPLIGSGMANAMKAGAILADVVEKDTANAYSRETLWNYQYRYYRKISAKYVAYAVIKNLLLSLTDEQTEELFEFDLEGFRRKTSKVKKVTEMAIPNDIIHAAMILRSVVKDSELKAKLGSTVKTFAKLGAVVSQIPKTYSENEVLNWAQKYNRVFKQK